MLRVRVDEVRPGLGARPAHEQEQYRESGEDGEGEQHACDKCYSPCPQGRGRSRRRASISERRPGLLLAQPKVKTYARTPGSRNVISKLRGAIAPRRRTSWYMRGSDTVPSPDSPTSRPW